MIYYFDPITERDVDYVIIRAFAECPEFLNVFTNKIGWSDVQVYSIEHSKYDSQLGESDITVILTSNGKKFAILIENKIDAKAMPNQYSRYNMRGNLAVSNGEYVDFAVFLIAPQKYIETNTEAAKYENVINYEAIYGFFKELNREFDCNIISNAIQKQSAGYIMQEVPEITKFWKQLYVLCSESTKQVDMYPADGPKGARSLWPQFKSSLKGTEIYYKSTHGVVDMHFRGKINESARIKEDLNVFLDSDMHWADTGSSISIRIKVLPVDFKEPFSMYEKELGLMLDAVDRMTKLALKLNDIGYSV